MSETPWYLQPLTEDSLAREFEPYRDAAINLTNDLEKLNYDRFADPPCIPLKGYVDAGSDVYVFEMDDGNLLKIPPLFHWDRVQTIRKKAAALLDARGRPGLEQIVAVSDKHPVGLVCEPAPGKPIKLYTHSQKNLISDEAFRRLFEAFDHLQANDLETDDIRGIHSFYDPAKHFTIIDLILRGVNEAQGELPQTLAEKVIAFASAKQLLYGHDPGKPIPDYAKRFYAICSAELGRITAQKLITSWRKKGLLGIPDNP